MKKERMDILNCRDGDILGQDIVNESGALIASKYRNIDENIKYKLFEMGIREVYVYNATPFRRLDKDYLDFSQTYLEETNIIKGVLHELSSGGSLNVEKINLLTDSIYNEAKRRHKIIQYIYKLKEIDIYTYNHSLNVAYYCMLIGSWLNLTDFEVKEIIKVGLLHDIGKLNIPLTILNKKGKLDSEEFDIMKKHTTDGYNMLNELSDLSNAVKLGVLMHHERENGEGYPNELSSKQIHLYGKICAVADVYDALISDRVYKKGIPPFQAFEVLRNLVFGQLNAKIVFAFLQNINRYYIGSYVLLNTGDVGQVVHVSPVSISKPIIQIDSKFLDLSKTDTIEIITVVKSKI